MESNAKAVKASEKIETARLLLRRPKPSDAQSVFHRYASDSEVTRYLSWPTHRSVADTLAFIAMSDDEWQRWPAGPYLVMTRENGANEEIVGSTGLFYKSATRAVTGYVFARDAWGQGYATEALEAMVDVARQTGVERLEAICHAEHTTSAHVLEKCGFVREEVRREHFVFPNLRPQKKSDVFSYARSFE
ncbi:GNAT family N-acetyltransferase [Telmatobacter sp. DSM 110680]|uniref:GNAT family N-acetyltransferase n=1 Tax=Telmatobacter sp. DSM 110680 TaxID=3036704 RepID=A0AAU7DDP2_9BACT